MLQHLRTLASQKPSLRFDTVRCAFSEGTPIYPGTTITTRNHIQVCVINPNCIKDYFLPHPIQKFNPNLRTAFRA